MHEVWTIAIDDSRVSVCLFVTWVGCTKRLNGWTSCLGWGPLGTQEALCWMVSPLFADWGREFSGLLFLISHICIERCRAG